MASFVKSTFAIIAILVSLRLSEVTAHGGDIGHDDEDSNDVNQPHQKGLVLVKVYCLIILFVTTFAGGISPYFLRWNEAFLLLGTQFAGGVFLGTSLMHFLSDSNSTFGDLTNKEYPFAFMLASVGYLLTMLGDCIVMWITRKGVKNAGNNKVSVVDQENGISPSPNCGDIDLISKENIGLMTLDHDHHSSGFVKTTSVGDTILLILALCFHSVFEGIAVGVSDTKVDAWRNLWTISLHKIFAAIAMGIALLRMIPERPLLMTVAYSFAFAISSPIGVGIGIAINATTQGHAADWTYAISMGIACGVFVYVAINHLIAKGFKPESPCSVDTPFCKFLAVLLGVTVIAIVMIWD